MTHHTPIDMILSNATLLYYAVILISMGYAGVTVFAKWIGGKFLSKFEVKIKEHKEQIDQTVKKQEDFLYDTSAKFDVAVTKLSTEFNSVGRIVTNVESEVRDIKHDVHDIGSKVNDHLVKSAIKWAETDNKISHHDNKIENMQNRFSDFMDRQEQEIRRKK